MFNDSWRYQNDRIEPYGEVLPFEEFTRKEQEYIVHLNMELLHNVIFNNEIKLIERQVQKRIDLFKQKWFKSAWTVDLYYDVIDKLTMPAVPVRFDSDEVEFWIEQNLLEMSQEKLDELMEWTRNIKASPFDFSVTTKKGEILILPPSKGVSTKHLKSGELEDRLYALKQVKDPEVQKVLKGHRMAGLFKSLTREEEINHIDKMMEKLDTCWQEKFKWLSTVQQKMNQDAQELSAEIEKDVRFLENEDYFIDQMIYGRTIFVDSRFKIVN